MDNLSRHIEACLKYQHSANARASYTLHRVFKCFNVRYYESYVTGLCGGEVGKLRVCVRSAGTIPLFHHQNL